MKRLSALLLALCSLLPSCTADRSLPPDPPAASTEAPIPPPPEESAGTEAPQENEPSPPLPLAITEIMADNRYLVRGNDRDWVEIHNLAEVELGLDGCFLSDDEDHPHALSLDGLTVSAGGYLVVELGEDSPFRLSADGETVGLYQGNLLLSSLSYPAHENGESFSPEGSCAFPSPGQANTEEGYLASLDLTPLPDLVITEVMSSNKSHLPVKGKCYDLVEVTNRSSAPLDLGSYTLTDKRKEPERYHFPAVTLEPGDSFVVWCSGDPTLGPGHASFKISSSGESLYLARDGVLTDALVVPGDLKPDESYGRTGNYPVYLAEPSFGLPNGEGFRTGIAPPTASIPSGILPESIRVSLSGPGSIHYTLDGSRPTTASPVYTGPLTIEKTTTIRAFCSADGRTSSEAAFTYILGGGHQLPVVSIAIPQHLLTGEAGILNHIDQDYEYEAMLTMIEEGEEKFSIPFGFRLHGNDSRKGEKQNFQLRFRAEYGAGKLHYPLFDRRDFDEYNSLLLKGGSEDYPRAIMRDELAAAIADQSTALYTQDYKPVVLYLGGEYWGLYYFRERFSDDYAADHLGVSPESVDLLYSYGGVQSGSAESYNTLLDWVEASDMTLPENYAALCEQVDIHSLMDWYICRSYMGDKDLANIRYFRSSESDGKWRWMFFDLDWSFTTAKDRPFSAIVPKNGYHTLILGALASREGRDAFLRRYAELMDSILNEEYILAVIDRIAGEIQSEIPADRARWGYSVSGWQSAVEQLRAYVRDGVRDRRVLDDLQTYFSLSDAEMIGYFGKTG